MSAPRGRGRLSKMDLLPSEFDDIVAWAAQELEARDRTQLDIYRDFVARCKDRDDEFEGELRPDLPSFKSFNRFSTKQALLTRRLRQTRDIVSALAETFDASESDDLTLITAETMKSMVFHMLADDEKIGPKEVMMLASGFRQAVQAQSVSTERRRKLEAEFEAKATAAVDAVAKTKGMTAETAERIKAEILGVGG